MKLVLNTRSSLGVLSSKRLVTVNAFDYHALVKSYTTAVSSKDLKKAAAARSKLLSGCFSEIVPVDKMVPVNVPNTGEPIRASDASAEMSWHATRDHLRVKARVTDAGFRTNAPKDAPWLASSFELWISPSGLDKDVCHFIFSPVEGKSEAAVWSERGKQLDQIKATWKRTAKGYAMDIRVPWRILCNYQPDWRVMPVDAAVNYPYPNGSERYQAILSSSGSPWWNVRAYAVIKKL